ncbi:MAG: hypothetical protein V1899_10040 [Planctomycetota bacterium]
MADAPISFRKRLKDELVRWEMEGIVTPDAAARLKARYELDTIGGETASHLIT